MSDDNGKTPPDFAARHLARRGASAIEEMQLTLDLARTLLESGSIKPYGQGEDPFVIPPLAWEISEPRPEALRRVFIGPVTEAVTGQGITHYFAAGLARDEDEFRRQLSRHVGHTLANGTKVSRGAGGPRLSPTLVSLRLRKVLEIYDQPRNAPASFFYLSRWHENRS